MFPQHLHSCQSHLTPGSPASWMEITFGYCWPGCGPGEWAWLSSATQWLVAEAMGGRALAGEQQLWVKGKPRLILCKLNTERTE